MSAPKHENVKVVVRCRPFSKKERDEGFFEIVRMNARTNTVLLSKKPDDPQPKSFPFSSVFSNETTQQQVYDDAARQIVESCLEGYNGTIFAYGQTGTGKTYTMEGIVGNEDHKGVILRALDTIFCTISKEKNKMFIVRCSFLQIYMEDVSDLLGDPKKKLHVRQVDNDVQVIGLSTTVVANPQQIMDLLVRGSANRATGQTAMNFTSSRSHSIFTVYIEQSVQDPSIPGPPRTRVGKLNLVDLAGSERLSKTEATGERAKEGSKINQSLLCLGNVISALTTGSKHIAYRDSKLTQLLQDSLGGNAKTVMVATLGPANYNYDETLSTLLYASRARDIKNSPKINEDPKDALINQFVAEIDALKRRLQEQSATLGGGQLFADAGFLQQLKDQHDAQLRSLMTEKNMNEEQRSKMRADLEAEYDAQMKTREESEKLKAKIEQMERSVLVGGVNLVDVAKQQEEEIQANESKLRRQREEQQRLAQQGQQEEEQLLNAEQQYGSLKEELTSKVHQIKKLRQRIKGMEESIDDMQEQFEREKEEQTMQIRQLGRELQLLKLIAASFIPGDELDVIERQCTYDPVNKRYTIKNMELAGCHRKVQEEEEDTAMDKIFIAGVEGAVFSKSPAVTEDDAKKKAEAAKKKQGAVHRMLNEFALADVFPTRK